MLACVAMLLPMSRAMAQAELPATIVEKSPLSTEDMQAIDKFLAPRIPDLSSTDPAVMKKSRDELLRPFRNPRISVATRQYISDKLIAELNKNAGAKDLIAVNALRIAGDMATSASSALLEEKLKDANDAVRYAAVSGLERTMEAVATRSPAITSDRVQGLVAKLGEVIVDPKSTTDVTDAGVRALKRAMEIIRPGFEIRPLAVRTLASAIGKLCERVDAPVKVLVRAGDIIREALTNNNPNLQLQNESLTQAATMSGQLLSWCACQIKKGKMPVGQEALRVEAAQIVKVAESSVLLCGTRVNKPWPTQNLGTDFEKATALNDRAFFSNLLTLLKPLSDEPFNIKSDTFLQCK